MFLKIYWQLKTYPKKKEERCKQKNGVQHAHGYNGWDKLNLDKSRGVRVQVTQSLATLLK